MDVNERTEAIANAPTENAEARLWVLGEWQNFRVVRVPVSALVLNIDNRRFAAERQLFEEQLGHSLDAETSSIDGLSVEAILLDKDLQLDGDRIVGKPGKDYLALRQDWRRRNQESPFWVRPDGTVRNGNRRLAMLRRLHREEGAGGYEYVDAVVLDSDDINEIAMFEMEQREQLTEDYKVRYTDINLLLAIKDAAEDKDIDWYDDDSIVEVAGELQHVMSNNKNYAVVQLYAIKYMNEYLDDLALPTRYDKLIGQIERFRDVGRIMRTVESDDPDRAPSMLDVLFAAVNAGMTHLEIRKIRSMFTNDRDEFDRLADAIREAEGEWVQPADEEALADPEVVDDEVDDPEAVGDQPEPPGPMVTNYPRDTVKDTFHDAMDLHEATKNDNVLKTVKEVNNRLLVLTGSDHDRLGPALAAGDTPGLREAVSVMVEWFDEHRPSST